MVYFENLFLSAPINSIAYIIKKKVTLPRSLSNSNYLINKYLSINNLIILLEYLTDLEENNKYLKDIIKNRLIVKYSNIEEVNKLKETDLLDVIITLNYEEITYNFLKNLEENRTREWLWEETSLEILVLSPGTLNVQQRNYLSIHLYEFGHGGIMVNSNLGHGSLNKNMA